MILMVALLLQFATQIQLYDNKSRDLGYISYTDSVCYVKLWDSRPEAFKVTATEKSFRWTYVFIENERSKGYVIISDVHVTIHLLVENTINIDLKFFRNRAAN